MKRILVALDSSPRAPTVLAAALRLAELADAKLIVYRAIGVPPDMPLQLFSMTDISMEDYLKNSAREDLARLTSGVPPERLELVTSNLATPWDGICRTARELDVDLIVVGSHGYGVIDRILGTNAGKVVNHADRNVLVIRTVL